MVFVSISRVINHMTCYNSSALIGGKFILKNPLKLMFSKKATKIEKNLHLRFDTYLVNVKSMVKIWSIFVAFLENVNFNGSCPAKSEVMLCKSRGL